AVKPSPTSPPEPAPPCIARSPKDRSTSCASVSTTARRGFGHISGRRTPCWLISASTFPARRTAPPSAAASTGCSWSASQPALSALRGSSRLSPDQRGHGNKQGTPGKDGHQAIRTLFIPLGLL